MSTQIILSFLTASRQVQTNFHSSLSRLKYFPFNSALLKAQTSQFKHGLVTLRLWFLIGSSNASLLFIFSRLGHFKVG